MRFFATAAKGTEPALRDELRELRFRRVRADRGGVHFEGELVDGARACLWSRVAVRVLLELETFPAADAQALYDGARAVDWATWMTPRTTIAVRAACRSSGLTHSQFVAQKIKDAIVDRVRDHAGARPCVDKDDPDVLVAAHLARDVATLYLDVSGRSLHERGWRARALEAPLRETLAAAVVRLSGWDRRSPFVDPMCGAGTIAIEAAALAMNVAPGLSRGRFGLERWASHDAEMRSAVDRLREEARSLARRGRAPVAAGDADARAVGVTRENARLAGVELDVREASVASLAPRSPSGFVVTNPPYGARLEPGPGVYDELARALGRMKGHTVALLAGTRSVADAMKRRPDRWWLLYNGPIECRLLVYEMGG